MQYDKPGYQSEEMDERTEVQFIEAMAPVRRMIGDEAFRQLAINLILPYEEKLRRECTPDHPALVLLDEWRHEQLYKERGFE